MALLTARHHAGTGALSEWLPFPVPAAEGRSIACPGGHRPANERAGGEATVSRPYYLGAHCHRGPFPADVELDIENTEFLPGVRRMPAGVGQEAPFDRGRQQRKLRADLEVTSKAVERTAEASGEDIAAPSRQRFGGPCSWTCR